MTKVVSLGLDGAAWHKLDELMAEGYLPNLSTLVKQGARGPLQSVDPPVTCPAWRCSTSGKNPGKVGVFWWLTLDRNRGEFYHPDADSFDTADIWDYLSEEGYESAVLNIPMTYPPSEIDGTMVSGFGAPLEDQLNRNESITHPESFESELYEDYDWQVEVDHLTASDGPEQAYHLMETRFELLMDLLSEDFDYLHLTIFYINMLQHKYGDSDVTRKGWELIDEYLGKLRDEDVLLVVYSDHGHTDIEDTFVINRWLHDKEYLSFKDDVDHSVASGADSNILAELVRRVGKTGKKLMPAKIIDFLRPLYRKIVPPEHPSSMDVAEQVDWEASTAVGTSQGPVYLNKERLEDDYESVKAELKSELESLHNDGEAVLSSVREANEVYSGKYLDAAPDLMLTANEGWEIYGGLTESAFVDQATSWTSGNHPTGIVLFAGEDVESTTLPERSILDVMPTVLSYMDCPLPTDIDGEVIRKPFQTEMATDTTRPPIETDSSAPSATEDHVKESLKDLGYLE